MPIRIQMLIGFVLVSTTAALSAEEFALHADHAATYVGDEWSDAGSLFAGADFLLVKPRFSEAVAFAEGVQTLTTHDVSGRPIDFDYEAGLRAFGGWQWGQSGERLGFAYTHMQGDAVVNGFDQGPGTFIVDPFGNYVGAPTVVDPTDARVGTTLPQVADTIRTLTTVELNVYDVYFAKQSFGDRWLLQADIGARIADVDEYYESIVTGPGYTGMGTFTADFVGAGPRLGLQGTGYGGQYQQWAVHANIHGSLLLGDHNTQFTNSVPLPFTGSQSNTQSRMIPVTEIELAGEYRPSDYFTLSSGWLFHYWHDLGASGGTFGGFFTGADDANSMSFDGLFLRAELRR